MHVINIIVITIINNIVILNNTLFLFFNNVFEIIKKVIIAAINPVLEEFINIEAKMIINSIIPIKSIFFVNCFILITNPIPKKTDSTLYALKNKSNTCLLLKSVISPTLIPDI